MNDEEKKNDNGRPGKEGSDLNDQGILFLNGEITDESARLICQDIIALNLKGKVPRIQLLVQSQGGSCTAGFAIIDLMEWSRIPVYTTGLGMLASMGLLVFMAGHRGHRTLLPRSFLLSHRFSTAFAGNHSQLLAARKMQDLVHDRIVAHYLAYSNVRDRARLEETLLRDVDTWLTPDEAVEYGLADVVEPSLPEREGF